MEIWKDINGYEGLYQVSNLGNVKSIRKNKILRPASARKYLVVKLQNNKHKRTVLIHRIVLQSFIGDSKLEVDHIDGNPKNNALSNLRYCTRFENIRFDNFRSKRKSKFMGVSWFVDCKKWRASIQHNNKMYHLGLFDSELKASLKYRKTLNDIKNGLFKL